MSHRMLRILAAAALSAVLTALPSTAAERPVVTAADYARAERFLGAQAASLVFRASVEPHWLSGDRFWYRNRLAGGSEFIL